MKHLINWLFILLLAAGAGMFWQLTNNHPITMTGELLTEKVKGAMAVEFHIHNPGKDL